MKFVDKNGEVHPINKICFEGKEYIDKLDLLTMLDKELERLWDLIPDASDDAPTQMELRYLGQYMQTERLIDELENI